MCAAHDLAGETTPRRLASGRLRRYSPSMIVRRLVLGCLASVLAAAAVSACVGDDPAVVTAAPGGQDGGPGTGNESGIPTEPCTATSCGAHGKCQSGSCVCDATFAGPTCTTCADGLQDKDANGTCTKACEATSCGPHSTCADTTGTVVCACAAGYAGAGDAGSCVWGGGLLDPGFQGTPATAWVADRGAIVDKVGAGSTEPGWAIYSQDASCRTGGRVTQVIAKMPDYASAEPLALKLTTRAKCLGVDCASYDEGIGVLLNGAYASAGLSYSGQNNVFADRTVCLGERSFGGPLRVELHPRTVSCAGGDNDYDIHVDHAEIVPLASCPTLKQIPNAGFEGTDSWTTSQSGAGTAAIVGGVGVGGSRAGKLDSQNASDRSTITGPVSIPAASVPNTALKLTYKATDAALVDVKLDGLIIGQLPPSQNAFRTANICVPEWAKGSVVDLAFTMPNVLPNGAYVRSFVVDDLSWATDATCPATPQLLDPGFERADVGRSWRLQKDDIVFGAIARTATFPHGGAAALQIDLNKNCGGVSATTTVTIPAPVGAAGPALKFFYKYPTPTSGTLSMRYFPSSPGSTAVPGELSPSTTYAQVKVCLDPKRAGQPETVRFSGLAFGSCANASFPNQSAWIDDVEITTDATCPAQ